MGFFETKPNPEPHRDMSLPSEEYDAAGERYLAVLKSGFTASLQADLRDDGKGEFAPLHLAASFAGASATTALLHYVPESCPEQPFFTRPEAVDPATVETVLVRMRWAMTYMLPDRMDSDGELIRAAMEESATFFARDEEEHSDVLVLINSDLLSEDTTENTLERAEYFPFVVECFNDGLEAGFSMLITIQAEGWQAVLDEQFEGLAD